MATIKYYHVKQVAGFKDLDGFMKFLEPVRVDFALKSSLYFMCGPSKTEIQEYLEFIPDYNSPVKTHLRDLPVGKQGTFIIGSAIKFSGQLWQVRLGNYEHIAIELAPNVYYYTYVDQDNYCACIECLEPI